MRIAGGGVGRNSGPKPGSGRTAAQRPAPKPAPGRVAAQKPAPSGVRGLGVKRDATTVVPPGSKKKPIAPDRSRSAEAKERYQSKIASREEANKAEEARRKEAQIAARKARIEKRKASQETTKTSSKVRRTSR